LRNQEPGAASIPPFPCRHFLSRSLAARI
jgi:hypothetical protein